MGRETQRRRPDVLAVSDASSRYIADFLPLRFHLSLRSKTLSIVPGIPRRSVKRVSQRYKSIPVPLDQSEKQVYSLILTRLADLLLTAPDSLSYLHLPSSSSQESTHKRFSALYKDYPKFRAMWREINPAVYNTQQHLTYG